jgi:hypothetical protein
VTRQADDRPGFPGQPMTRERMIRKFRSSVATCRTANEVDNRAAALRGLERTEDLSGVLATFTLLT